MRAVLYLHGFGSSPEGRKIGQLRKALRSEEFRVVAPDLNLPSFEALDFEAMAAEAVAAAREIQPDVVVGSSLGALVALEAARRGVTAPLVLVAPALGFGSRWIERLAPGDPLRFFHHGANRELPIHRRFFEAMASRPPDAEPPAQRVTVIMGDADESVPFAGVEAVWRVWEAAGRLGPGSELVRIRGGDHGLVSHVDRIASEIRRSIL